MNTLTQPATNRSRATIDGLRSRLRGQLSTPADSTYEEIRKVWNAMIETCPAIIGLPETNEDVSELVRFAVRQGLPLSIRGGGHNVAGTALAEDGLTIDMRRMKRIDYDPTRNRARVEAGARWGEVDAALEPFGMAIPGGIVSTTGVAGLTLGGGFGWLTRSAGYTSERVTAATIVTADGQIRRIDASTEPELFWAIRGGGGNFGVVTEFEFEPVQLGPRIAGGMALWPIEQAPEIIDLFQRESAAAPDALSHMLLMRTAPAAPFLPESIHGKRVVGIAAMYAGPVDDGMRLMEPIGSFGTPVMNSIGPKPFRELQAMFDAGQPSGRRYYWKSVYFDDFGDDIGQAILEHADFRSAFSSLILPGLGGVAKRHAAAGSTATSHLGRDYLINFQAAWEDPAQDDELIDWARDAAAAVQPWATGHYVNFMTADEVRDPARPAYEPDLLARLERIKSQYDPANVFRFNKNITPARA